MWRDGSWWPLGALSVLFGLVLVAAPGAGALAVVWIVASYAVVFGITLLALAWRLRDHAQRLGGVRTSARPVVP